MLNPINDCEYRCKASGKGMSVTVYKVKGILSMKISPKIESFLPW